MKAVKSRFGWHPCSYDVFLKLKRLKKRYWETLRAYAKWRRWQGKMPYNRTGPEPDYCPFFVTHEVTDHGFLAQLLSARTPRAETEVVVFGPSHVEHIEKCHVEVEAWFNK